MRDMVVEFVVPQRGLGIFLGAVARDGRSYICEADSVVARDEASGRVLWVSQGGGDPLEIVGEQLLCCGRDVSLLSVSDGSLIGVFSGAEHRCCLVGNVLVDERLDGTRGIVTGRTTNRTLWEIEVGSNNARDETFARRVRTVIANDGTTVFFGLNDGVILCVSPETGKIIWSRRLLKLPLTVIRATSDAVHLLVEGSCVALDKGTGGTLWEVAGGFSEFFGGADKDQVVVWNGREAIELAKGRRLRTTWLRTPKGATEGIGEPFVSVDGYYLAGSGSGRVMAFDSETGDCVASVRPKGGLSTKIGDVSMAVGKGRIYYRDWSKRLYCLRAGFLDGDRSGKRRSGGKPGSALAHRNGAR